MFPTGIRWKKNNEERPHWLHWTCLLYTSHLASVETAKESQRGIVDIETLKKTNQELIQTLDDVMKIQQEGREKRQAAEADMRRMENELKTKLLEIRR